MKYCWTAFLGFACVVVYDLSFAPSPLPLNLISHITRFTRIYLILRIKYSFSDHPFF